MPCIDGVRSGNPYPSVSVEADDCYRRGQFDCVTDTTCQLFYSLIHSGLVIP